MSRIKSLESSLQYHAYVIYRDLGHRRSYIQTGKQVGKSPNTVASWAKKFDWHKRIEEYKREVEKKQKEGALVKVDDPVMQKMVALLNQTEALIDSAFTQDISGKLSPKAEVKNIEDLIKLVAEYRKTLEVYHKFMAEYRPKDKSQKRSTTIKEFNIIMGNLSQQERITMLERMKNGNDPGGNSGTARGVQDADYTEIPEQGNED